MLIEDAGVGTLVVSLAELLERRESLRSRMYVVFRVRWGDSLAKIVGDTWSTVRSFGQPSRARVVTRNTGCQLQASAL